MTDLEDTLTQDGGYYGPTTPEEVDEEKERPWLYEPPSFYDGPTTPEEVDDRKSNPGDWGWSYQYHSEESWYKGPDD